MTAPQKRQFWRDHMTQWQDSKMTQLAYCRQHQLCPHKFGYYKRVLVTRSESASEKQVLVTRPEPTPQKTSGFVSVQVLPQLSQPES